MKNNAIDLHPNKNATMYKWESKINGICHNGSFPKASLVIATYNNKDLTILSLRSALNQDYPNLEIVISDDSSTDGIFQLMLEECEHYSSTIGKHSIILNRNGSNLGICKNYEKSVLLSSGDIIVIQGGDDISYPNRVSSVVNHWITDDKKATVIFHKLNPIGLDGKPLNYEWWPLTLRNPLGAAMAYTSVIKEKFEEIQYPLAFEDNVFARRAFMYGDVLYIDEKLIDYRVGSGFTSSGDFCSQRIKISHSMVESTKQNTLDIEHVKSEITDSKYKEVYSLITEIKHSYTNENNLYTSENFITVFKSFIKVDSLKRDLFIEHKSKELNLAAILILRIYRKVSHLLSKNNKQS